MNFQVEAEFCDKEGRYVLVRGCLDQKRVTLVNVYLPPGQDNSCIKEMFQLIASEASGVLLCGGDWNMQLQPQLDSSNIAKKIASNPRLTNKMLMELGMIDTWRDFHPKERQFTFYSASHGVYSRIDYFFTFNSDRHRLKDCTIGVRDISDHSPVYLTLHLDVKKKNTLWRLNTSILNDKKCNEFIKKEFEDYMDNNNNGEVSPSVLWDAAKSVIRGKLVAFTEKEREVKD